MVLSSVARARAAASSAVVSAARARAASAALTTGAGAAATSGDAIEFAVPRSKHTRTRTRVRRAGQRAIKAKRQMVRYRICENCGSPVRPHYLCMKCNKVTARFSSK